MTRNGCPLCGEPHAACGQPSTVTPVDLPREEVRTVGELKRYTVTVNGTSTVLKLTAEAAKTYPDATPVGDVAVKSRTVANKSRSPQNKKGGGGGTGGEQ